MDYSNWEADKVQGCVCDSGFEGYDCSQRSCPRGRDPTSTLPSGRLYKDEVFRLQCQATGGYFSLLVLGQHTPPIPFDADPGHLRRVLEDLDEVGQVSVTMPAATAWNENSRLPSICGDDQAVTTEIAFTSHSGDRPPLFVSRNTSNTRQWTDGATPLSLEGGVAVLRMETRLSLHCPVCPACSGLIYFTFLDSVSSGVEVTALGAGDLVQAAVLSMSSLSSSVWTQLGVEVSVSGSGSDRICSSGAATTTQISVFSDYGNIPGLGLLDTQGIVTLETSKGDGALYECSNQGVCDHRTGVCECAISVAYGEVQYRALSSNGFADIGNRGDCGFIDKVASRCIIAGVDICSGHGQCSNSTGTCQCTDGWFGIACATRSCPVVSPSSAALQLAVT